MCCSADTEVSNTMLRGFVMCFKFVHQQHGQVIKSVRYSGYQHASDMQEPAPALLRGPLSPTSPEPGASGVRSARTAVMRSHSDGMHAAEAGGLGYGTAQGEAERQGQLGGQCGRRWRSALERTSMQLRDNLMSVPEGVLPMGDATGQVMLTCSGLIMHLLIHMLCMSCT